MLFLLKDRVLNEGRYIVENKATIRQTAKFYGVGKSTVHKHIHLYLQSYDKLLFNQVIKILQLNFEQKHIRGGNATKLKYGNAKK